MQQKTLYKRASFFIDVTNVVLYTDLFLYHELKERMKNDESLYCFFNERFPAVEDSPENDTWLVHELSGKKHQNILEDWIDKELFLSTNASYLYDAYINQLYANLLSEPICDHYIQITEFGNTLRLLMKDEKLKTIYFYVPFESEVIFDNLRESFFGYGADKVKIVVGKKNKEVLPIVDSYVFENVRDVDELIRAHHSSLTEVLIPTYDFNMVEDRTDLDKMIEQVTYHRLALSDEDKVYVEKFNLAINTISVPI
jgi:hypothetical protein